MKTQNEILSGVDHLIEICNERKEGYKKAAETVKDLSMKTLFEKYAQQSFMFSQELLHFSDKNTASEIGTRFIADTWRVWMDIKAALTNGGEKAILEASITGEEAAIRNYKEVLEDTELPGDIRTIVQRQLSEILSACTAITELSKRGTQA